MPRCIICDYSDETPSILNEGLSDGVRRRALFEQAGDTHICETCLGVEEQPRTVEELFTED